MLVTVVVLLFFHLQDHIRFDTFAVTFSLLALKSEATNSYKTIIIQNQQQSLAYFLRNFIHPVEEFLEALGLDLEVFLTLENISCF